VNKNKNSVTLYIIKEAAKSTTAADPAKVNLFKAAPLCDGASAGEEIDDGVTAEGVTAGESAATGEGDGGELMADGEGEGALFTGTGGEATGEVAEGETAGDGAATGDLVGEDDGD
jgi:hypothetical protein